MCSRVGSIAVWSKATAINDARPEGRRAARLRRRRITAEAHVVWRFGAQRQDEKSKRRLLSRHLIPRPVRRASTMGPDSAVGDEAVVPLGAGPRSSRKTLPSRSRINQRSN